MLSGITINRLTVPEPGYEIRVKGTVNVRAFFAAALAGAHNPLIPFLSRLICREIARAIDPQDERLRGDE